MGVNLKDLLLMREICIDDLKGKVLAIDSYNMLYQFLTTIRTPDGKPLMDSKGNVTSHLIGLFSRTTQFLAKGIKPVFVFDGEKPVLKTSTIEHRAKVKHEARLKYEEAMSKEDIEAMKKYGGRFATMSADMVDDAKELIRLLGLPIVQAPCEGEAQASYLVKRGDAWAVVSQDYDSLLYGADRAIHNLSIAGKRKKIGAIAYETVKPSIINLAENLNHLGIDQDKLIVLAILVGTDYNPGGIKGIGPKTALKLVKEYNDFDKLFKDVKWDDYFDFSWKDIFNLFKKEHVTSDYTIKFGYPDKDKLMKFLVEEHDFSKERVEKGLAPILRQNEKRQQKSLGDF
ncbi:MAG: flap endonuclease-1 [Candidatus Woesearchaeota archaeon]